MCELKSLGSRHGLNNPLLPPIGRVSCVTPPRGVPLQTLQSLPVTKMMNEYTWAQDGHGSSDGLDSWSGFSWVGLSGAPSTQQTQRKDYIGLDLSCPRGDHGSGPHHPRAAFGAVPAACPHLHRSSKTYYVCVFVFVSVCLCRLMQQKCRWVLMPMLMIVLMLHKNVRVFSCNRFTIDCFVLKMYWTSVVENKQKVHDCSMVFPFQKTDFVKHYQIYVPILQCILITLGNFTTCLKSNGMSLENGQVELAISVTQATGRNSKTRTISQI